MRQPSFKLRPLSSLALRRFYGIAAGALTPGLALAAPAGGVVVGGQASIGVPSPGNTVVNQTSQNAIVNWQQFSVGGNEFVLFNQPNASAAVLNRVVGGLPSEILGNISANGRVFIVNPQGVMFGAGSRVDVGGLVTSTLNIRDQDFMSGRHVFAQGESAPGTIRNEGRISAGPSGFVVLAADRVENAGLISAPGGDVLLASGSKMTLTLDAEGLVGYSIDAAALSDRAGIENIGEIVASGGTVVLDAKVARSLMGNVINQRGRISARSVEERDGVIYLSAEGGDIENSGTLDASGTGNADGGRIVVHSDQDVRLTETGVIRADGAGTGDGGMIRLVAEQQLETAAGSVVSATAGPAGQLGGFVELSGHGGLKVRGQVNVGRRGQVLIDPLLLTIADGAPGSSGSMSSGTSATVYEQTIENLLRSGADVALVADNRITLATLTDGSLDGRNANGTGGGLLLGIGTISEPTTNGVFIDGPPPVGYTFNPGPGGSSYGGIFFQTLGNAIRVDGRLRVSAGYSLGNIRVGDLEGDDLDIGGVGDIELGDVQLSGTGGSVVIRNTGGSGSDQDIVIGSLSAVGANTVEIDAQNDVQIIGNLQADAALVEISSGYEGSGQITASDITGDQVRLQSGGGDISVSGVITANGGFRSGGDIDVDAVGGSVTLNGVTLNTAGQADISASSNAQLLGSYELGADDGELRIYVAGTVTLGAPSPPVGITITGGLDITAGTVNAYGPAADSAVDATGDVSIRADAINFDADLLADGAVDIESGGEALNLLNVSGGRVRLAISGGGDIVVGTISADGGGSSATPDVEVSADGASLLQIGGISLADDGYALLSVDSGITGLDGASFTVGDAGTLELRTLNSLDLGSVFEVDGNLVGSGASVTGNVVDVGGNLTLTATGGIDLNAAVTAGGLATLVAGDNTSLSLASLEADGIVLYGGSDTSISADLLTANGGFGSSGDINVDAYGSSNGRVSIGSIQLNTAGRVDITGAAGVYLRDGADVNGTGTGGSLNLRADGGVLQLGSSAGSPMSIAGNLSAVANNGARIEAYQDVVVTAGDAILNASGSGAAISLFGVLGAEDGRIEIDATGPIDIAGLAAGSSIQVDATGSSGSVSIGAIGLASPGSIRISGSAGVTLDGEVDAGIGGSIQVSASGGLLSLGIEGAPSGSAQVFTGNLSLETTNGVDVLARQDVEVVGGDLSVDADADLAMANVTAASGGVRLAAGGDINVASITADGGFAYPEGVSVIAEGADPLINLGPITLLTPGAVYLSGVAGVTLTHGVDAGGTTGTIEVRAGSGTLSLGTASGAVSFTGNLAAYADSGAGIYANISGAQDVELQVRGDGVALGVLEAVSITADGDITLANTYGGTTVRGDISIGSLDAGGDVSVTASRDVTASGTITAVGRVDVDAGAGVGGTGVATLDDVSGNRISVEADGGVSTGLLTAVGISSGSGDFNIYVASAETVSVSGITLTGGNNGRAYLQGDNGITLDGTSFSLGSDGTLKLSAASSGLDFGTNFSLTGNLDANAGEIDGGAMTVTGDITLKSPGDIDLTGFVNAGGRLEIDGQGGAGVINLQGVGGDRVYIVNDGDITIAGGLNANGGGSTSSHDVDVLANGGTLAIGGLSVADPGYAYLSGDDVNLSPVGSFAVGYGGQLKINAVSQISFGTGVSDQVSVIGSVHATAQNIVGNRILVSNDLSLTVGAELDINAATGLLRADSGDLVINGDSDGAIIGIGDAVADRILITNRGAITTGTLTADGGGSAGNRDIHIQALSGGTGPATINVGTLGMANLPAEGYVELYAQDGVVLQAGANVGASGGLKVTSERGLVDLGNITQAGALEVVNYEGDIQAGNLTANTVSLYNDAGAATANVEVDSIAAVGNVTIDARDDMTVNGAIVSTTGVINLEAGGAVDIQGASGTRVIVFTGGSITTGTLTALGAGTSAGNADVKIESTAGSVDVAGVDLAGPGYAYLSGDTGIAITGTAFDVGGGTLELRTSGQLDFGDGGLDSFELDGSVLASAGNVVGTSVTTLGGGNIDIEVSGTANVGTLASAGDLRVVADDGIVLGQDASATGDIELRSSNQHASILYTNLTAGGGVTVSAQRGNVALDGGDGNITAGNAISVSAQRIAGSDDVLLSGNIEVGSLRAGTTVAAGGVKLDASGGVKLGTLETGASGLADIDGDSLVANVITAAAIEIDLLAGADAGTGDGSAVISGDIEATAGSLHLDGEGLIDVEGAVTATDGIILSAGTGLTVDGLASTTGGNVEVSTQAGAIVLTGGASAAGGYIKIGDMLGGASQSIVTGGLSALSVVDLESSGNVTVNGTIDGSGVTIRGDGVDLNGNVNAGAGNVDLDGATVDTLALTGAQVLADATGTLNVVGGITATSGVSIGGDGGTTVSGLIDGGTGDVDIGAIGGATGAISLAGVKGGDIRIGDMFGGEASSITTLDIAASGNLDVSSTSGNIDIGSISLVGGAGSITSGGELLLGSDVTAAGDLTISAAAGDLVLQSLEATAGYLQVNATAGTLSLVDATAGNALTLEADGDLTATGDLTGATVVVFSGAALDISGLVTADAGIELGAETGVNVDGQISGANVGSAFVDVYAMAGQIELAGVSAANGSIRIGDMLGGAADGISTGALSGESIDLRTDGAAANITVNGTVGAGSGAAFSAGGNLAINAAVSAAGLVDLEGQQIDTQSLSGSQVFADASGQLTVVGTVSASNGISLEGSGVSASGLVDGDAGYVDIGTTGSGTIQLASVSGGDLRIGDSVFGGTASDIMISGSLAATGTIEVVSTSANIDIGSIGAVNGDITVDSGGTLAIGGDISSTAGGLSLTAGQGGLDLANIDVAGDAEITVQDGDLDIDSLTAGSATLLTIDNGSITTGALTTTVGDLVVDAVLGQSAASSASVLVNGDIESEGLVKLTAGLAPGATIMAGNITAGTSIDLGNFATEPAVAIEVGDLVAGGSVFAKTDGASLQVGRVEAGGDIGLYALNDSLTVGGDILSTGGAVTIQADADLLLAGLTANGGALSVYAENGSVNAEAVSASGTIFIQSDTGDVTADSLDGDGGITVNALNGQLTINGAVTASGGSIGLNGGDGVLVGGLLSGADDAFESITVRSSGLVDLQDVTATGGSVDVESSTGNITAGAVSGVTGIRLSAGGTLGYSGDLTALNGDVTVYAGAGDLLLANLTAGGGNVSVQAVNGVISANDVSASGTIFLQADNDDVTAASLDGDAGMTVNAYNGSITVTGPVSAGNGSIALNSGGTVSVDGDISGADEIFQSITVRGAGSVNLQNVTATGGSVDVESTGDDVSVLAVSGVAGIRLSAAGTVDYSGDLTASSGGVTLYAGAGDLLLANLTAGGGNVSVQAVNGVISANDVSASGTIFLQADSGAVTAASLDGDGGITVNAYDGQLTVNGPVTASGGSIALNGSDGVLVTGDITGADDAFESITVRSSGLVDLQDVTASAGSVDIESDGGNLQVGAVSAQSNIRLSADGTLAYSGDLNAANGGVTVYAGAGDLSLANLTAGGGAVTVQADGGSVVADDVSASGSILIQSGTGDVTAASLDGEGGITVNAYAGQLTVNGAVTASGGSIALNGGNGIEVAGDISGADDAFDSIGIRSGNGAIELQDVTATGGSIVIDNSLGGMSNTVTVGAVTAAGNVDIASIGNVTLAGAVSGAVVEINADTLGSATAVDVSSTVGEVYIDADVQAPVVDLEAATFVTVAGSIDAGPGGSVSLIANDGDVTSGAITTSNLTVEADTIGFGNLDLTGNLSLTSNVGDIVTGSLDAASISLDSAADIVLGGAVTGDSIFMSADDISGVIDMTAAAGTLELDAATVTAGNIDLSGQDGVTVSGQLLAAGGSVTLLASNGLLQVGGITANDLEATALSIDVSDLFGSADATLSGDVSLTATAGDILGGDLSAGGSMVLSASNAIDTGGIDGGSVLLVAASIDAGAISAGGDVSATAATGGITAASVNGANVTLTAAVGTLDSGAITASAALIADAQDIILGGAVQGASVDLEATNQLSATGLLDVTATAGTLRLAGASLGGNGADLSATGAVTLVGNLGAGSAGVSIAGAGITADDIGGGSLLLSAGTGLVDTDNLTATAGAITVTGGSIDAGVVSASGNVTATAGSGALTTSTIGGSAITLTANNGALSTGAITGTGAVTADAQSILLVGAVQGTSVDLDAATTLAATGLLDVTATAGTLSLEGTSLGGVGADLSATDAVTLVGNLGAGTGAVSISGNGITTDNVGGGGLLLSGGAGLVDTDDLTATAGALTVTGGSIDAGVVSASGNVTATASSGALTTSTIGGSAITLTANNGALTTGAITGTGAVTADAQSISLGGAVQGTSVDLDAATTLAATGLLDVTATAGTLSLEGASLGGVGADLSATGAMTLVGNLSAGTGAVTIGGNGITTDNVSGGSLLLSGGTGLVDTDDLTATAGVITVTGGSIDAGVVSATGNVTATASTGALKTSTIGGSAITLTANNGALSTGAITGTGAVTADAQSILLGGAVQGTSVDLDAATTLAATGLLDVTATAGTLSLEGASLGGVGADLSATGAVTLVGNLGAGTGAVSISGNGITTDNVGGGSLLLSGGAGLVDTDDLTATAGAITVTGGSIDAGVVSATGNVTATASSGGLTTSTIGGGAITLTANSGALSTGAITGTGAVTADAQSILLGGAVQGASIDLDAVTTLASTGLLDVTATAGTLSLEGASLGGVGADLSATGAVTLVGNLGAGTGAVTISGNGITADNISGGSLLLTGGTGLVDTDNLTATAGAITVTGASIDAGVVSATGNVTATASSGALTTSTVGGNVITLAATGGTLTTGGVTGAGAVTLGGNGITADNVSGSSLLLTGGTGLVSTDDLTATAGTITVTGGSIDAGVVSATGNVTATASSGALTTSTIGGSAITLTANSGALSTGAITGTGAVTADAQSISLGGAVQGSSIDLESATTLAASGLLDVSATAGSLSLKGSTISGNGADLDATGSLTLVGALNGGSGAVLLDGSTISANAISTSGNVTATALSGNLGAGAIGGNVITLAATGGTLTTGAITGSGAVTADANAISLGGAVSGASVDLDAATTLTAGSGLLDVTATGGSLVLEGGSLAGNGANLQASGGITLVGTLTGGNAAVIVLGSGITADAISGGSLSLAGNGGAVETGNLTATLSTIGVDGGSVDVGVISAPGNVTVTASSGDLSTSTIGGGAIILTANAGTLSTGAITGSGMVTADANAISLGGAVSGTMVDLDAATTLTAAGLLDVSATSGLLRLEAATLSGAGADLDATGSLTVVGNLDAGSGAVTLDGTGITVDGISTSGNVTALATAGNLGVGAISGNVVSLTASGALSTAGVVTASAAVTADADSISLGGAVTGATVDLEAVNALTASGLLDVSATGGLVILKGSTVSGTGADLDATGSLTVVGALNGGSGAVTLDGSSVTTNAITTTGNVTATAASGNLGTAAISGNTVTLTANAGTLTVAAINATGAVTADAQQIVLGGAVSGAGVDLAATGGLSSGGLLSVSGGNGPVVLAGSTITGSGISVTTTGSLSLDGATSGGTGLVTLAGSSITADDIGGGSLLLTSAGLVDTGNLSAGAGGIVVTGGSIVAGNLTATGGGDITATATTGNLSAAVVSGDVVTLKAAGSLDTDGITANQLSLTSGGALSTLALQVGGGGAVLEGGSIDTGSITVTGGDLQATATAGDLRVTGAIDAQVVELTADLGDIDVDGVKATNASFSAPVGAITVGAVNASGDVDFDFGTELETGVLTLAGTLFADLSNADAVFGNVNAQAVDITVNGGSITIGNVQVSQDIDLSATGSVRFGDLSGRNISVAFGQDSSFTGSVIDAGGSFDLSGSGVLAGNALEVTAQSITLAAGLSMDSVVLDAEGSLQLGAASFDLGSLVARGGSIQVNGSTVSVGGNLGFESAGDVELDGATLIVDGVATLISAGDARLLVAELSGGRYTIQASGSVLDAGEGGSLFDVAALGISAGEVIELGNSSFVIGTGVAAIGGDPALLSALSSKNPELLPASQGPNASFMATRVALGSMDLAGDYLYLSADEFSLNGSIDAPLDLFVHFSPRTADADLGIEAAASLARQINLNREEHFNVFPGTTFAIGGMGFGGDIYVGENGPVTLSPRQSNFVFMTEGSIFGLNSLATNGSVVVLGGSVVSYNEIEVPLSDEFKPDLPGDELTLQSTGDKANGFGAGEVEYESAPEEGDDSLQCT